MRIIIEWIQEANVQFEESIQDNITDLLRLFLSRLPLAATRGIFCFYSKQKIMAIDALFTKKCITFC